MADLTLLGEPSWVLPRDTGQSVPKCLLFFYFQGDQSKAEESLSKERAASCKEKGEQLLRKFAIEALS